MTISDSERRPLLQGGEDTFALEDDAQAGWNHSVTDSRDGESFDKVPKDKRQIGITSAIFLIVNRMIGSGIYATPAVILKYTGSVGMSLVVWLVGAVITAAGMAINIELGTGLPRNGGDKNYLEFMFRHPKYLATCAYAVFTFCFSSSSANSVVFSEYLLHAFSIKPTPFASRVGGILPVTIATILHGIYPVLGLRIQNTIGFLKLFILLSIPLFGFLSLVGFPGLEVDPEHRAHNFDRGQLWEGTKWDPNTLVTALFAVLWSFVGYSSANNALSEAKDPVRTLKVATPLAVLSATIVFLLVNIAFFIVVPKSEVLGSGYIIASLFFRTLFGDATDRVLSGCIALSALGTVFSAQFTGARVIQELGREGVIPFSSLFASNKPFNTPLAGLLWPWLTTTLIILFVPPGDLFKLIINLTSYPGSIIHLAISLGLLYLHTKAGQKARGWSPPFKAWRSAVLLSVGSSVMFIVVPFLPPAAGSVIYAHLPYWLHIAVSIAIISLGVVYWYIWWRILPRRGGYKLAYEVLSQDGMTRNVFKKVHKD